MIANGSLGAIGAVAAAGPIIEPMKKQGAPNRSVVSGTGDFGRRRPGSRRPVGRRDFGVALASLGAAAMLGLPREPSAAMAPAGPPPWATVLASLGQELASGEPVPPGSRAIDRSGQPRDEPDLVALAAGLRESGTTDAFVCTPSGWLLSGGEADACRRIHARLG